VIKHAMDVEPSASYDKTIVRIGGFTHDVKAPGGTTGGAFVEQTFPIQSAGDTAQLQLELDTVDHIDNRRPGWFIDDIQVISHGLKGCGDFVCKPTSGLASESCSTCPDDCGPCP
jgi:hypothetical protein